MGRQITKTHKNILNKNNGFTLVELIIVITILAILATIAFISFKSYSGNARDGNRVTALSNIQKGLDIYQVKVGNYPHPDDVYGTGTFGGDPLNYVGYISGTLSRVINMNTTPIDPKTQDHYVYGVSSNYQKYQLATTLEELEAGILVPTTYAAASKAKVVGNYTYPLRLGPKIYSLPSLIFVGNGDLINNSTGFIVNNGQNIPYSLDGANSNSVGVTEQLKEITGQDSLTLTGINIGGYTSIETLTGSTAEEIAANLGITVSDLGTILFPKTGTTNTSNNGSNQPPVEQYTVTFNSNGGSTVSSQTVSANSIVTQPTDPTKTRDTFLGWYTDAGLVTQYNFTPITENITLYAKWGGYQLLGNGYYLVHSSSNTLPNGCSQDFDGVYLKEKCILKIGDIYVAPSSTNTTKSHWDSPGAGCTSTTTTCSDLMGTTNGEAATYCTNLKNTIAPPAGTNWFLPPREIGGLRTIQENQSKIHYTGLISDYYWSSTTDYVSGAPNRWGVYQIGNPSIMWAGTDFDAQRGVRCIAKDI